MERIKRFLDVVYGDYWYRFSIFTTGLSIYIACATKNVLWFGAVWMGCALIDNFLNQYCINSKEIHLNLPLTIGQINIINKDEEEMVH